MSDERYHYPADVFTLLVDTIPLLCKGKRDVMLFLEGAGVPKDDLAVMWGKVTTDRSSVGKYDIVRDVLQRVNKRGDSGLAARREIIKRVVEFEEFSTCWPTDVYKAKSNVNDLRKIVQAKDSFTRMKDERDAAANENAVRVRTGLAAATAKRNNIDDVRARLNALFGLDANPQKRGKLLESVLNDLFRAYGIHVKEDFKRVDLATGTVVEQIDGIIEFDSHVYLVEMKWLKDPVGVNEYASHMIRLYGRADARGLFISTSGYTAPVITECTSHLNNRTMVLASLQEFVLLLMSDKDLLEMLRTKVAAALIDKNPFLEVLS
jgi:restriction endonuclease Mrr